jgi:hypothetical protein
MIAEVFDKEAPVVISAGGALGDLMDAVRERERERERVSCVSVCVPLSFSL